MKNSFGKRLKNIRKLKALGQTEFASGLGVSVSTVSKWERGLCEPNLNELVAIAVYFGVSVDYLIGLKNKI